MGHNTTAIIIKGDVQTKALSDWDLILENLPFDLKLVYIDYNYTACWQKIKNVEGYLPSSTQPPILFPIEIIICDIAKALTGESEPDFTIIYTDYFGGMGEQFAQVYKGYELASSETSINDALSYLGVKRSDNADEFDTVGLGNFRSNPDYLEKYGDMAEELGI